MIQLDTTKRAARMIEAGRVTVTFRSPTGRHITLTAKCRAPQENGRWATSPLAEAKVIFIEVPGADGGWGDKVGKINSRGFTPDRNADEARIFCAKQLLAFLAGQPTSPGLEIFEEERCGKCGRALTDPVSIERGIGPECYGRMTGSEHQTKTRRAAAPKAETPSAADAALEARSAHAQAELDGTHAYAQAEIASDQVAFEAGLDTEIARDKKGVPMGAGDWRARAAYLETCRSDDLPASARKQSKAEARAALLANCSQMDELPGETFEDIFSSGDRRHGPSVAELEAAAAARTR